MEFESEHSQDPNNSIPVVPTDQTDDLTTIPIQQPYKNKHKFKPSIDIGKTGWNLTKGVEISWNDVNVWAAISGIKGSICCPRKQRFKQILVDVNGSAKPGRLHALLAPSGSGKTTLLNYLSNMLESNLKSKGSVLIDGKPGNIKKCSAYVHQTDLFFELMTVREHLDFHARLRMGKKFSAEQRETRVEKLLNDFGLSNQQHIQITNDDSGRKSLSGGEKRRLSIITELLTDPEVLFADEPTSGLDSSLAENIVYFLQQLTKNGKTIICTIHQPSSSTLAYFDDLTILSEGYSIYSGPMNFALKYFDDLGYPCPIGYNPADHFIYVVSQIRAKEEDEKFQMLESLSRSSKTEIATGAIECLNNTSYVKHKVNLNYKYFFGQYKTNPFLQFWLLLKRALITNFRNPFIISTKILQDILLALLIGLTFLQMPLNTANVINYGALLFFEVAGLTLNGLLSVIVSFPREIPIYSKENAAHLYRSTAYFLAKTFSDMPLQILQVIIFTIIVYLLVGLRPTAEILSWHLLTLEMVYQASISYGYLVSALARNPLIAAAMATPMVVPIIVFGGFLLQNSNIPIYLRWVKYISWFTFGFENIVTLEFVGRKVPCTKETCALINIIPSIPGDLMLLILELNKNNFRTNFLGMFLLILIYRAIGCLIIIIITNIKNNLKAI